MPPTSSRRGAPRDATTLDAAATAATATAVQIARLREELVANYSDRMQLRRSLAELQAKNVENSALISARQVRLARWEHGLRDAAAASMLASPDSTRNLHAEAAAAVVVAGGGGGSLSAPTSAAPPPAAGAAAAKVLRGGRGTSGLLSKEAATAARREVLELQHAIVVNNKTKVGLLGRLEENERVGNDIRTHLEALCGTSEGHREVLSLEYRVNVLELEKVELEQGRLLYERMVQQVRGGAY